MAPTCSAMSRHNRACLSLARPDHGVHHITLTPDRRERPTVRYVENAGTNRDSRRLIDVAHPFGVSGEWTLAVIVPRWPSRQ